MRLLRWTQTFLARVILAVAGGGWETIMRMAAVYSRLDDDALRAEYEREAERQRREPPVRFLRALQRYRNTPDAAIMAISIVAFTRSPADLPLGSEPYPEQVRAAQSLIDGLNVQMETGEGKTYAIALALPTLVARHGAALVLTVNEYLAERDRQRVAPFLEFLGIAVQSGLPTASFRGVSYLSLSAAGLGYVGRVYRMPTRTHEEYPAWAAVVLDEIDSLMIDEDGGFSDIEHFAVPEVGWSEVFECVTPWEEHTEFTFDRVLDSVSLTPAGWRRIQDLVDVTGLPAQRLHQMAEAAVWTRFAEEGRDYVRDGETFIRVNPVTGNQVFQAGSILMKSLVFARTGKAPWTHRNFGEISRIDLLAKHPHVVGLSGTAAADLLYYWLVLGSWTMGIPARFPRETARVRTRFFARRAGTLEAIVRDIADRRSSPTVIIAWTMTEAVEAATFIRERRPDDVVNLLTVFDSDESAALVQQAGSPGVITVLSAGGCRGVDIRSGHRPHLVVLGHGPEPRLDRQALGRVGRHGEPFTAEFIEDADTRLVRAMPGLQRNLDYIAKMGGDGELRVGRQFEAQFRRLQMHWWRSTMTRRTLAGGLAIRGRHAESLFSERFLALQRAVKTDEVVSYISALEAHPDALSAVLDAMERRSDQDATISGALAKLRALPRSLDPRVSVRLVLDEDARDTALLAEITEWGARVAERALTGPELAMRGRQLKAMAGLRFRVASHRDERSVVAACYSVLKTASASYLDAIARERDRLWVNYSGASYFRKLSVLFTIHAMRISESVTQNTLDALQWIDKPERLAHLFPKVVHYARDPSKMTKRTKPTSTGSAVAGHLPPEDRAAVIDELVTAISSEMSPTLFAGGPSERELSVVLRGFARSTVGRLPFMTSAQIERELGLEFQRLITNGHSARDCRVYYRAQCRLVNRLVSAGVGTVRIRERTPTLADHLHARLQLAGTIAPVYLAWIGTFFALAAVGVLVPSPPAPEWLAGIGDVLAFGWLFDTGPTIWSVILGCLVVAGLAMDASGVIDKHYFLPTFAPWVAAIATGVGTAAPLGIGLAIVLACATLVWTRVMLMLRRTTAQGSGVDPIHVLAALSVAGLSVMTVIRAVDRQPAAILDLLPWAALGAVLCAAYTTIPVLRSVRSTAGTGAVYHQEVSSMRVSLDPTLNAGFLAFVLGAAFLPWMGSAAGVAFVILQVAAFAAGVVVRARLTSVQKVLTRREYGQLRSQLELRRILTRRVARTLLWLVPLGALAAVVAAVSAATPLTILIAEIAGYILLVGWREVRGIVAGGQVDLTSSDTQLRREQRAYAWAQFTKLIRKPVGWIGATLVVSTVVWNTLSFAADIWTLPQFAEQVWKWLTGQP